jgi:branched-chain amino acid transport system permease protein
MRPWVAVVALIVAVALIPQVLPQWTSFLVVVGLYYLVVIGLDLFEGQAGQVSLGQTMFFGIGAYGAGVLSMKHGVPTLAALVISAAASGILAFGLGRPFLRLRGYYLALATLSLAVIAVDMATQFSSVTGGTSGLVGIPFLAVGSFQFASDNANYYLVAVLAIGAALFVSGVRRSASGRALAAIASDEQAALMLGVHTARYKTRAFVIAAILASVAGSLFGFYNSFVSPDSISVVFSFNLVIMLALGGARTAIGPLVGVLLLQLMPRVSQGVAKYEPLVAGVLLILIITDLPEGIWGTAKRALAGRLR